MYNTFDFHQYQFLAKQTAKYGTVIDSLSADDLPKIKKYLKVDYAALGLASEAAEVAGKVKKILRDKGLEITDEDRKELSKELGDVIWYVAALATDLNLDLDAVAKGNIDKLRDRANRGVLGGSGDNR